MIWLDDQEFRRHRIVTLVKKKTGELGKRYMNGQFE